ncbi:MAG: class I SAM-dependent methyltransferase [Desulfoferrobacter sp.]
MHQHKNLRSSLNAYFLNLVEKYMDNVYGPRKRSIFANLSEKMVEIGPGAGANFRYFCPGTSVVAIEPNSEMHPYLKARAERFGLDLDIRGIRGEEMDLGTSSVGSVVGTLVLCSVDNPSRVVSEVHRILMPGGRYIFLEHVAAPEGSKMRSLQNFIHRPWRWLFEGCNLNRNTHTILAEAGFTKLEMDCFTLKSPLIPVTPHIFGMAVK